MFPVLLLFLVCAQAQEWTATWSVKRCADGGPPGCTEACVVGAEVQTKLVGEGNITAIYGGQPYPFQRASSHMAYITLDLYNASYLTLCLLGDSNMQGLSLFHGRSVCVIDLQKQATLN
eukprot:TRINITY_DN4177_c0_g1_i5.p1 TRINITY_DN4177_c0_g1~~TRINITY_DN4177_c0_g1_i5.p1  ORF type:complete len:119 (+),score=7.64 TRINITY_DN4177_c0_g1_i5:60-416(+)